MADKIRWGILGPGAIARSFATGLKSVADAELAAVGSRSKDRADAFGNEFQVPHRHASYEDLAADRSVDVIYVATPHPYHLPCATLCLEAGKPVLCEKPLTVNAGGARQLAAAARDKKLFLMEGMWTRFYPAMYKLRELLASQAIGEVRMLHVDLGFRAGFNPTSRLFDPALAGGSLLDVGVYCTAFCSMIMGEPKELTGLADIGATGVDEQAAWVFKYDGGRLALCSSAVRTNTLHEAAVFGTDGVIRLPKLWWQPHKLIVKDQEVGCSFEGNAFQFEARAVGDCLRAGKLESEVMPLDESVAIARTMDRLRELWGVRYPME